MRVLTNWRLFTRTARLSLAALLLVSAPACDRTGATSASAEQDGPMHADIALIEDHLANFFERGDFETALAQLGRTTRSGDGTNVSEILYQQAIDAEIAVDSCTPAEEPRVYDCTVAYSNMLFDAVGHQPHVVEMSFRIISDKVLQPLEGRSNYPGQNEVNDRWFVYEIEAGIADTSTCRDWGSTSGSCSQLQRDHLEDFADWYTAATS